MRLPAEKERQDGTRVQGDRGSKIYNLSLELNRALKIFHTP
jgi:hypothetical protein